MEGDDAYDDALNTRLHYSSINLWYFIRSFDRNLGRLPTSSEIRSLLEVCFEADFDEVTLFLEDEE